MSPGPAPDDMVLVHTYHGKGILMRPYAPRPATAKAAASTSRKLATRLSREEKHGRKRMAELACIYDAAPVPRTPADVITPPGRDRPQRHCGPVAAGKWLTASATAKILAGKAAAAGIGRRATSHGYTGAEREGANTCADYLTAQRPYLGYATALANGWPIATGAIEEACRWLVKDRMDITGARWRLDGAEAILKLRALISTGDFDDYWAFRLRQERQRIYQARYRASFTLVI